MVKGAPMKEGLLIDDLEVGTLIQQPPPTALLHPHTSLTTPSASSASASTTTTSSSASQQAVTVKKKNGLVHFMAGGLGGMAGAIVTCPLEVVKTRMQSSLYVANPRLDLRKPALFFNQTHMSSHVRFGGRQELLRNVGRMIFSSTRFLWPGTSLCDISLLAEVQRTHEDVDCGRMEGFDLQDDGENRLAKNFFSFFFLFQFG